MNRNRLYGRLFVWFLIFLFLMVYLYMGRIYVAFGPSMEPTLYSNDRIMVDKRAYEVVKPSKDDILAFPSPRKGAYLVKRVVADGSDEVKINKDGVSVNSRLEKNSEGDWQYERYVLADDELFVLGDNRYNSEDSRDFGPVKIKTVVGKVKYVVWPPSRWGVVR